ncbi:MAG: FHA domain-containing protein [Candidatus Eremiobacteraeota bacterium]|nr:FHA domain-containing protein [Candidatus Eremiobacteraeota bacterium]
MIFNSGYQLEILEGLDQGKKFPLRSREVTLGRKLIANEKITNWILFNELTVSRIHALLVWEPHSGTYEIHHKSRTNPTLVNAMPVQKLLLAPGDLIQMGYLIAEFREDASSMDGQSHSEKEEPSFFAGIPRHDRIPESSFSLRVIEGDDRGMLFPLSENLMILGRREKTEMTMGSNEILLHDMALPAEHLLFAWNVKEKKFSVIKVESSILLSKVQRKSADFETILDIDSEGHTLLEEGDLISTGSSLLRYEKSREAPPSEPPAPEPSSGEPPSLHISIDLADSKKARSIALALPRKSPFTAERSGEGPARGPELDADCQIEVLEGPDRGTLYTLISADLREGRYLSVGYREGPRVNDLPLSDRAADNIQASFVKRNGILHLRNESEEVALILNGEPQKGNHFFPLQAGDEIRIGETRLIMKEYRTGGARAAYRIEVREGVESDRGKTCGLESCPLRIGTEGGCEIRLSDDTVSPLHARITSREGKFFIEHLCATGQTLVNGLSMVKGSERLLRSDDCIRLSGKSLLLFIKK